MKTNNSIQSVNVNNVVANFEQGMTAARSTKYASASINQARKALGGIQNEAIVIGKNDEKKKIYTTIGSFLSSVGCPYSGGQVALSAIKAAVADYLKDKDGNMQICKNVVQRTKVGKSTYVLYRKDENGKFKSVSIYQPAPVRDNGWDPYKICVMLVQSKFIDDTIAMCEASKAEFDKLNAEGGLYVHDELTDEYVPVTIK